MNAEGYAADQTGKREWRARVWHEGRWHTLGCRDNQADALKAARKVWHSLRGDWSGGSDTQTLRERYGVDFPPEAFTTDGEQEIIRGTHGDMRERGDWLMVRFRGFSSAELLTIGAQLERDWYGSKKWQDGHLFAAGIGRPFSVAMGGLIGAPLKRPTQPTEGIVKVASGAQQNQVGPPPKNSDPPPKDGGNGSRAVFDAQRGNWRVRIGSGKTRRWAGRYATKAEAEAAAVCDGNRAAELVEALP